MLIDRTKSLPNRLPTASLHGNLFLATLTLLKGLWSGARGTGKSLGFRPSIVLCLSLFVGMAHAQLTTITGTIQRADGSFPSGSAVISWNYFVTAGGAIVPAGSKQITITNGAISTSLYPNVNSNPPNMAYRVVYTLTASPVYTKNWFVPTGGPVNVTQIEYPPAGNVGPYATVSPAQLTQAGAVLGECLTFNGNFWSPGTCAGSPGSTPFSNVTSGTNTVGAMILGSGSSLTYSGTGTNNANRILGTIITALSGSGGKLLETVGALTTGNVLSADSSGNAADAGFQASNIILTTGSYADPSWITSLAGSKITGTMTCSQLPAFTGDITKASGSCATIVMSTNGVAFAPSATTDTTIASNILSGTLSAARLPAINLAASGAGGVTGNLPVTNLNSGTGATASTAWFGDGTWKSITAGGTVTHTSGPLVAGAIMIGNSGNDATVLGSLGTTTTVLHGNAGGTPSWSPVILTADVSGLLPTANGGLNSSSIAFSGPSGGAKTFALPNADATILTTNTPVTLAQGGTGADLSGIAKGGLIVGTAAGTVAVKVVGTNGFVLSANSAVAGGVEWVVNSAGTGTVTSIATTSPITGGTITATGTIACATCVTSAAALTTNALILGAGLQASAVMASLGTTTTVLHGNSGGAPTWAAVSLTGDVSGTLPVANGGTGLTGGTGQLQYLRTKPNSGNNTTYEFASLPMAVASDYNFPAQFPGGSLSVGACSFILNPLPIGVTVNDFLYLSGGVGAAEAVPVSGIAGSTVTAICANTHSGAWAVSSTSGGLQDAICSLPAAGGTVMIPSQITLLANVSACNKTNVSAIKQPGFIIPGSFTIFGNSTFALTLSYASTGNDGSNSWQTMSGATGLINHALGFGISTQSDWWDSGFPSGLQVSLGGASIAQTVPAQGAELFVHGAGTWGSGGYLGPIASLRIDHIADSPSNYSPAGIFSVVVQQSASSIDQGYSEWNTVATSAGGAITGIYQEARDFYSSTTAAANFTTMELNVNTHSAYKASHKLDGWLGINFVRQGTGAGAIEGGTAMQIGPQGGGADWARGLYMIQQFSDQILLEVNNSEFVGTQPSSGLWRQMGNHNWQLRMNTAAAKDWSTFLSPYTVDFNGNTFLGGDGSGVGAGGAITAYYSANGGPIILGGGFGSALPGMEVSVAGNLGLTANSYYNVTSGANVASAGTITPTGPIFHVTGVSAIATINLPTGLLSGCIDLIPDGAFTTTNAGNVAIASTAVVGKALRMCYDTGASKWYPSY